MGGRISEHRTLQALALFPQEMAGRLSPGQLQRPYDGCRAKSTPTYQFRLLQTPARCSCCMFVKMFISQKFRKQMFLCVIPTFCHLVTPLLNENSFDAAKTL